jgi:hypothetical protein
MLNQALGWELDPMACGLHKKAFTDRLKETIDRGPEQSALERASALAKVVAELRNTLHAEPLGRAYLRTDGRGPTAVVSVHREVASSIADRCATLGTYDRWLMNTDDGCLLLNPFAFVNDLAAALPAVADPLVTRLLGAAATAREYSVDEFDVRSASNTVRNARLYGVWLWSLDPTALSVDGLTQRGPSLTRSAPPHHDSRVSWGAGNYPP